jgi:YHS domain-containing protein
MKRIIIIPFVLLFLLVLSINSSAQEKKMDMKKKVESTQMKKMEQKKELEKKIKKNDMKVVDNKPVNTVCPVSAEEIENADVTATYNGKTYALCCKRCLKKFNSDPEKYISKLSEDGKSLKKNKNLNKGNKSPES